MRRGEKRGEDRKTCASFDLLSVIILTLGTGQQQQQHTYLRGIPDRETGEEECAGEQSVQIYRPGGQQTIGIIK